MIKKNETVSITISDPLKDLLKACLNYSTKLLGKLSKNLYKKRENDDNAKLLFKKQKAVEQQNIVPYVRTCSFCWSPCGNIVTFHYNKLDVKQLKPTEKIITNFNNLEDWVKYCKADETNKFSRTENKLIDDDSDIIITDKLKKLVDWNNLMDVDEAQIVSSINRVDSLPSLFLNNFNTDIQIEHFPTILSNRKNEKDYFLNVLDYSNPNSSNTFLEQNYNEIKLVKKKFLINVYYLSDESMTNRAFIIENLKIKLLSKEHFFASINVKINNLRDC
jgi:hypothetical protein